ncbi:hypothetical protein H0H92_015460 [Tricholoma furcatifolium]|nr:hypothetical protein H0H92_015460 [Tricholoma furcatifolium]
MAYTQSMSPHQQYRDVQTPTTPPMQRKHASKMHFVADLSQCLFDFVIQLLPTTEEMAVKEDVRKLLERLIRTIEPDSRLLSFGSTANGFNSKERLAATDLVTMLGDLLERETKFHVKPLPHARIPIVKLSLDPSPGLPLGIACDIGFENRLALENTRLLMCYAMIDPTRVRTLVLFLWSKRRKINSPYKGTLSSYGYVLLVIYFLVHVKNPPVLPNLQQLPPMRPITTEDTHVAGYNTWFFDDIELLRQRWHSENTETVAELNKLRLIDFFRYYSRDFPYNTGVASIRAGLLKKDTKGWQNDIRGEFMRASRVLATRPERAIIAVAELCEERKDEDLVSAPTTYSSPRVSLPPQTPYTVGSQSMRPKGAPPPERLSPPSKFFDPGPRQVVSIRPPQPEQMPEHMAPKRSKWTSPPPAEAPSADHSLYESQLGKGLELATSSSDAREREASYNSSSSNSEFLTDDENRSDAAESDDVTSVRSYTEGSTANGASTQRRPSWHVRDTAVRIPQSAPGMQPPGGRVRYSRPGDTPPVPAFRHSPLIPQDPAHASPRPDGSKRHIGVPPRPLRGPTWTHSGTPMGASVPLPPSPESPMMDRPPSFIEGSTVFYQTTVPVPRSPRGVYPSSPGQHSPLLSQYQNASYPGHGHGHGHGHGTHGVPSDIFPPNMPPTMMHLNPRTHASLASDVGRPAGPETPTPATYAYSHGHGHSLSTTTVTGATPPPPHVPVGDPESSPGPSFVASPTVRRMPRPEDLRSKSRSPPPRLCVRESVRHVHDDRDGCGKEEHGCNGDGNGNALSSPRSPHPSSAASVTSNGSSPTPSSTGYAASLSRSPSPRSPGLSPPPTAVPLQVQRQLRERENEKTRKVNGDGGEHGDLESRDRERVRHGEEEELPPPPETARPKPRSKQLPAPVPAPAPAPAPPPPETAPAKPASAPVNTAASSPATATGTGTKAEIKPPPPPPQQQQQQRAAKIDGKPKSSRANGNITSPKS